jgi:hypothetical protein
MLILFSDYKLLLYLKMLTKVFSNTLRASNTSAMTSIVKRGAYTAGQEPKVFVNKNTRVLCQGITGKHVS